MIMSVASIDEAGRLADTIIPHSASSSRTSRTLLELIDPAERLERVLGYMRSEIEILEVEKRIRTRVKKQMEKTRRSTTSTSRCARSRRSSERRTSSRTRSRSSRRRSSRRRCLRRLGTKWKKS